MTSIIQQREPAPLGSQPETLIPDQNQPIVAGFALQARTGHYSAA